MKTAVVILNWNTRDYLRKFLPGLITSTEGLDAEVIVADNASTDGSLEMLAAEFPDVRRISLDRNYGFTGGYNRALAQVEAEYFVLINSDIEVPQGWLKPLTDWMDTHPHCGACGPKLLSYDHRDRFEYAGAAGGLLDRYGYPFCRGRILQHRSISSMCAKNRSSRPPSFFQSLLRTRRQAPLTQKTSSGVSYCPSSFSTFWRMRPRQKG